MSSSQSEKQKNCKRKRDADVKREIAVVVEAKIKQMKDKSSSILNLQHEKFTSAKQLLQFLVDLKQHHKKDANSINISDQLKKIKLDKSQKKNEAWLQDMYDVCGVNMGNRRLKSAFFQSVSDSIFDSIINEDSVQLNKLFTSLFRKAPTVKTKKQKNSKNSTIVAGNNSLTSFVKGNNNKINNNNTSNTFINNNKIIIHNETNCIKYFIKFKNKICKQSWEKCTRGLDSEEHQSPTFDTIKFTEKDEDSDVLINFKQQNNNSKSNLSSQDEIVQLLHNAAKLCSSSSSFSSSPPSSASSSSSSSFDNNKVIKSFHILFGCLFINEELKNDWQLYIVHENHQIFFIHKWIWSKYVLEDKDDHLLCGTEYDEKCSVVDNIFLTTSDFKKIDCFIFKLKKKSFLKFQIKNEVQKIKEQHLISKLPDEVVKNICTDSKKYELDYKGNQEQLTYSPALKTIKSDILDNYLETNSDNIVLFFKNLFNLIKEYLHMSEKNLSHFALLWNTKKFSQSYHYDISAGGTNRDLKDVYSIILNIDNHPTYILSFKDQIRRNVCVNQMFHLRKIDCFKLLKFNAIETIHGGTNDFKQHNNEVIKNTDECLPLFRIHCFQNLHPQDEHYHMIQNFVSIGDN